MQTNEDVFYRLGKIVLLPGILGAVFLNRLGREGLESLPACVFRQYTGWYCPGCGGTRALFYLSAGRWGTAFLCHPFVCYAVWAYIIFMTVCFYRRHLAKKMYRPIRAERLAYAGIVILLLQFVIKNILLACFHIWWL